MKLQLTVLWAFFYALTFIGCNSNSSSESDSITQKNNNPLISADFNFEKLEGTWLLNRTDGFVTLEFVDTNKVILCYFLDSIRNTNDLQPHYFYYKDIGRLGSWSANSFWIETDAYKLSLDWIGDQLMEQVKEGKGDVYNKVLDEEQIAYHFFDSSSLNGRVVDVFQTPNKGVYQFILHNETGFYTVYPKWNKEVDPVPQLISKNDSLFKKAYATHFYVFPHNKDTVLEIEFENRSTSSFFKKLNVK